VKLAYVDLSGFRGYRKPLRIEFADSFTIIDGRNGVGKSTIFDAVEFALTGTISKYGDAKAAGESVVDYLWWIGKASTPEQRFVEVGFYDSSEVISIRRTQFGEPDAKKLARVLEKLCDQNLAPQSPMAQLCTTSIIRDEHIASLSLDLKEADRYALLRDALGANDADAWIARAGRLVALAKRRVAAAQQEVTAANNEVAAASRHIDEVRAVLVAEGVMADAVSRLRRFTATETPPDRLAGPVRERIAAVVTEIDALQRLISTWDMVSVERLRLEDSKRTLAAAEGEKDAAASELRALAATIKSVSASELAAKARDLISLVTLGRKIGLQDGHCPLCAQDQSHAEFNHGIAVAEAIARRLDEEAAREAEQEIVRSTAELRLTNAQRAVEAATAAYTAAARVVDDFDRQRQKYGFDNDSTIEEVSLRHAELRQSIDTAQKDLRVLETLRLSGELERAQRTEADVKDRLARLQERSGRARKGEATAQALYDASRRAAGETLDQRLDRVLPLMSEFYRRLRPHTVWRDIEYSIRGDVKRFLKLQVGEELNPQFLFSSGQRRATGLAFLLSVNVSLSWSRWRSILLDDPVQHVDDFRTVHLAELTAQLVAEGRQIICAVEDAALADLLCRRLPINELGQAKRVTLGPDDDGALAKLSERQITPLVRRALLTTETQSVAS
jgi:chromosome segregation protein